MRLHRRSRREQRQRAAAIRRSALHEAGHAVMAAHLGIPIYYVIVGLRVAKTVTGDAPDQTARVLVTVAGVVAEALDASGPQSPESWAQQPDRQALAKLSATEVAVAFQAAMALLLSDADTSAAVLALAGVLQRRRFVTGWGVRCILAAPHRYPPRPPRRRNGPPDAGYIRRTIG